MSSDSTLRTERVARAKLLITCARCVRSDLRASTSSRSSTCSSGRISRGGSHLRNPDGHKAGPTTPTAGYWRPVRSRSRGHRSRSSRSRGVPDRTRLDVSLEVSRAEGGRA